MSYITYHNHDTMSLLDSCLKTKDLVKWAVANKMNAVGVTNHGEMSSLLNLYKECNKNSIKPILGIEFYVTENKLDKDGKRIRDNWHLIALCKNKKGWDNLIKLHNISWSENRYYYDPRITLEDLIKYKDGLVITSACIGGVIGRPWMNNEIEKSIEIIKLLKDEFKDDFYLELQDHNDEDLNEREKQYKYNKFLIKNSKELNIKCVIQNDSHYYLKEDWEAHQVLLCKNTGSKLSNPKFKFGSKEYYLKNEVEMLETFNNYPLQLIEECIANTQEIANKIENFNILNDVYDCPTFGDSEETYNRLVYLTKVGLLKRFGKEFLDKNPEYIERIKYELKVVKKLNFVDYFLMLEDLISYTDKNNIYTGIGRGSCVGSLVLYCLGVVHADPIKYGLLFERFLNEDRVSMCDADEDIADIDRQKVIEYVKEKFGEDHVCNIGTYGELTAKASFKAVASILEIPFSIANSISNIMDSNLTLEENYKQIDEFRDKIDNDDLLNKVYKISLKLEGTYAQRGTHACGMVISSKPLDEVCGCVTVKDTKTGKRIVSTSNEMKEVDGDLKLLKMDYLGLRNLSILKEADRMIKEKYGNHPDYKNLDINDSKTYKMLSEGNTLGVFQFESNLMKNILKQMQPKSIEDLSCVTSLARPGCTASGITQKFLDRKNGKEEIVSFAEGTEDILKESLQLPIYQEQIMLLSRKMAGFTGSEADFLRKCIGKKDPVKLKAERSHFVNGCVENGYDKDRAEEIFDGIEECGSYLFNKSHSIGYSIMSYATAYYKVHYPVQYMCALLNSVADDLDKLNLYIGECYRLGVQILPPDVNESGINFMIIDDKIRFGLNAIKGLGKTAVNNIIQSRTNGNFTNVENFIERTTKVDKSNLQSLLRVGAFNQIEKNPKKWDLMCDYINDAKNSKYYTETLKLEESIYRLAGTKLAKKSEKYLDILEKKRALSSSKKDAVKKQELNVELENIIDTFCDNVHRHFLRQKGYEVSEKIQNEQELLGFNVSTNPYKRWSSVFEKFFTANSSNESVQYVALNTLLDNSENYIGNKIHTVGFLSDIKEIKTKRGNKMAKLLVEYCGIKTNITIFAPQWENNLEFKIQKGNLISIVGKLIETNKNYSTDDYEIKIDSIRQLNVLTSSYPKCEIDMQQYDRNKVDQAVKKLSYEERNQFLPIEKVVIYRYGDKCLPLCGLCWINDYDKLLKILDT